MRFLDTIEQRPRDAAHLYIIAQVTIWTLVPFFIAVSLPLDVVRGLGWGHEWQLGYPGHPPLPYWLVEFAFDAMGDMGPFLLSQLAIAVTGLFVLALGREIMGERKAAIGTVLLAGVYCFSIPSTVWNPNLAQMPVWAAMTYFFYKALCDGRMWWWLLLGVASGIGLMTAYSSAVLIAVMGLYLLSSRDGRARFLTIGPYLALAACLVTVSPHLWWLAQNNFSTLHFVTEGHQAGIASRILSPAGLLLVQFAGLVPALLLAAFTGLSGRDFLAQEARGDGRFLLWMGLGPALLTVLLPLVTGFAPHAASGAPMWNLTGLVIVYFAGPRGERVSFARLGIGTLGLLVLMPAIYVLMTLYGPWQHDAWPDKPMARSLDEQYQLLTGQPVRIVAGDDTLASLIALRSFPRASVLANGDRKQAPWIAPQRLAQQGALIVWRIEKNRDAPPRQFAALAHFKDEGIMQFSWPRARTTPMLTLGWGIVPAQP